MKSDLEVIYSDRCSQLARHVAALMALSEVSPIEAVEMVVAAARESLERSPEAATRSGKLVTAGLRLTAAAVDWRLSRRSDDNLVRDVEKALSEFKSSKRGGKKRRGD